jgi:hypothetical protein
MSVFIPLLAAGAAFALWLLWRCRKRNVGLWLPAYVKGDWAGRREREARTDGLVHVMFCVADHFEPAWAGAKPETQMGRVNEWVSRYPEATGEFLDADGRPPRHTFFYPAEEYRPEILECLADLVAGGRGEVEVHLHHDGDTAAGLRRSLAEFTARLRAHGHLGRDALTGHARFGFVHGNWALDNSRPDGRWCGVNDELRVLRECGCYADFTLPSAPSPTQTRRINSIYYATDDPERPKSHDEGVEAHIDGRASGDLLLIQGPLTVLWPGGRWGIMPRLENGNLSAGAPPGPRRTRAWIRPGICVTGRPDWVFVKVHTHGCQESNAAMLLGEPMRKLHRALTNEWNDGERYALHYVTAREAYNIVRAAERGLTGDPGQYRDLEILPPPAAGADANREFDGAEARA